MDQVQEEFVVKAREVIAKFYGADPKTSPDYCRIINDRHTERWALLGLSTIGIPRGGHC